MWLFDSVYVDCPHCGAKVEFQSDADGDPYLNNYTIETAPLHILRDVMNEPEHCAACDGWLVIVDPRHPLLPPERPPTEVRKVKPPDNPRRHPQGLAWWPDGQSFGKDDLM